MPKIRLVMVLIITLAVGVIVYYEITDPDHLDDICEQQVANGSEWVDNHNLKNECRHPNGTVVEIGPLNASSGGNQAYVG